MSLRLFVPAEDWKSPIDVEESELELLQKVATRLGEPFNRIGDKVFLGRRGDGPRKPLVTAAAPPMSGFLRTGDLHLVVDGPTRSGKLFSAGGDGEPLWHGEARCEGLKGTLDPPRCLTARYDVQNGDTPPGRYEIVRVEFLPRTDPEWRAFGWCYLWLVPVAGPCTQVARSGIGGHGGGSNLSDPWAARQGFLITHGCTRFLNEDVLYIGKQVQPVLGAGHRAFMTVTQ